jgi:hypothetical protein
LRHAEVYKIIMMTMGAGFAEASVQLGLSPTGLFGAQLNH